MPLLQLLTTAARFLLPLFHDSLKYNTANKKNADFAILAKAQLIYYNEPCS